MASFAQTSTFIIFNACLKKLNIPLFYDLLTANTQKQMINNAAAATCMTVRSNFDYPRNALASGIINFRIEQYKPVIILFLFGKSKLCNCQAHTLRQIQISCKHSIEFWIKSKSSALQFQPLIILWSFLVLSLIVFSSGIFFNIAQIRDSLVCSS